MKWGQEVLRSSNNLIELTTSIMTKRERVIAAMNNQRVDRPPVGFWFHFKAEQSKEQLCVDTHLDYYNTAKEKALCKNRLMLTIVFGARPSVSVL